MLEVPCHHRGVMLPGRVTSPPGLIYRGKALACMQMKEPRPANPFDNKGSRLNHGRRCRMKVPFWLKQIRLTPVG